MENQSISLNPFMIIYKRIIYNNNLEEEKTFIHQKFIEINDFLLSKANSSYLTHEDFNLIRKFAISEGGFIENKFRKILWKKIFNISDIRHNSNHSYNKIKLIKLQFLNEMEYKYEEVIHDKVDDLNSYKNNLDILHLDLIKRDVERSAVHIIKDLHKINSFFNFKKLKSDLVDFIVKIFSLEKFKYDYYQGYHDLVLFIFLIFQDSQDNFLLPILIAQRINEIFLSDYLNKEKNFVEIIQNNLISVLKITDIEVYNEILNEDPSESFSSFCLSWIICLFAQKFENSEKIYRILDFIFCSDSSAVYHLAANVCILK